MLRKFKKFTLMMIAGANIVTVLIMLLIGYSDRLDPVEHTVLSSAGLAFPIFLIFNLGFLVFWVVFKWRYALIPVAGYLLCISPLRTYLPLNVPSAPPKGAIKVLSYNVWYFGSGKNYEHTNPIITYLARQQADIVCLQEANINDKGQAEADSLLRPIYPYCDTSNISGVNDMLTLYSKYPILKREDIKYSSKSNHSVAYYLKIDGDTVIVINNHLESIGLTPDDKSQFKSLVKGDLKRDSAENESKRLIDKLGEAAARRAPQAKAVAEFITRHKDKSIICVGDFNDSPISFTHHTIASKLTDCYTASGNGPGISYHQSGFYFRIDNILCSDDWEPYGCKVDNSIADSDHYPIICWLKKRPKTIK